MGNVCCCHDSVQAEREIQERRQKNIDSVLKMKRGTTHKKDKSQMTDFERAFYSSSSNDESTGNTKSDENAESGSGEDFKK